MSSTWRTGILYALLRPRIWEKYIPTGRLKFWGVWITVIYAVATCFYREKRPLKHVFSQFVFYRKNYIFVITKLVNSMKKIIAIIVLAGFLGSCSQYTCPTYNKKEAPKSATNEKRA